MSMKRLPTDKTVVTELKIQLVDRFTRNRVVSETISARISQDSGLKTGDATVTDTQSLILSDIESLVYVNAWGNFLLRLEYADQVVQEVPCTGLFLLYGKLKTVEIRSAQPGPLRLSYIYA
jgi:hypothetical protein